MCVCVCSCVGRASVRAWGGGVLRMCVHGVLHGFVDVSKAVAVRVCAPDLCFDSLTFR